MPSSFMGRTHLEFGEVLEEAESHEPLWMHHETFGETDFWPLMGVIFVVIIALNVGLLLF